MSKRTKTPFRGGHKHIHQEDAFTKTVEKVYAYYTKSPVQAILTTIGIIGIIILGSITISRLAGKGGKEPPKEASLALMSAQQLIQRDPMAAEDTLRQLVMQYPRTKPGKKAHYYLGQVLYMQGRFSEARQEYEEFSNSYPVKNSFLLPAALFAQGNCLEEEKNYAQAVEVYLQLPEKYPESSLIPYAKLAAGRSMMQLGQYDRAKELYGEMVEDYPRKDFEVVNLKAQAKLGEIDVVQNMIVR